MDATTANVRDELYLVLRDVSSQLAPLLADLLPMSEAREAGYLIGVDALYQDEPDMALLCLRFEEAALDVHKQARLINLATQAGISVLDPRRLAPDDRHLFYQSYLPRYPIHIDDHRSPRDALESLGKLLGLITGRASTGSAEIYYDDQLIGDEDDTTSVEGSYIPTPVLELDLLPMPRLPQHEAEAGGPRKHPDELDMALGPAGRVVGQHQARGKPKRSARMATIPARPANARAGSPPYGTPVSPTGQAASSLPAFRPIRARMSSPPPFVVAADDATPTVRVRFQRGDSWMPARLRNLTTKEVRLAASAAPALGMHTRVAVNVGDNGAMLHGTVVEVVNTERSVDGSTTFRLAFDDLDERERDKLVLLLRMAQRQGVSLTPPPPRANRRFAVSWPVAVVSDGHRFNAAALDISERGLFVATTTMIRANRLAFGIPIDRENARVQGRARVARRVSNEMAHEHGLQTGYGLQIEDLSAEDQLRYEHFLLRVRRRSEKHILVVGDAERSQLLSECFHAAGYAVSKATTLDTMLQRMHFDSGGPNLAVLDQHSLSIDVRKQFIESFEIHEVPILCLDGHTPYLARNALDEAMSV